MTAFTKVSELPDADLATSARWTPQGLVLLRQGHPALADRIQWVRNGRVLKFSGPLAAACWSPLGLLRIGQQGTVELLQPDGAVRVLEAASPFPQRVRAAAAWDARGQRLVVAGGARGTQLFGDAWAWAEGEGWRPLPALPFPQMAGVEAFLGDTLVIAGGYSAYPLRGGDRGAALDGQRWRSFACPPFEARAITIQALLADAKTGSLILARGAAFDREAGGAATRSVQLLRLRDTGGWDPLAALPAPGEGSAESLVLAFDPLRSVLIAVAKVGAQMSVFEAPVGTFLERAGERRVDLLKVPEVSPLRLTPGADAVYLRRLCGEVEPFRPQTKGAEGDQFVFLDASSGVLVEHRGLHGQRGKRTDHPGGQPTAVLNNKANALLAQQFELVPHEQVAQLIHLLRLPVLPTPPLSAKLPTLTLLEAADGPVRLGGPSPLEAPVICDCGAAMTFLLFIPAHAQLLPLAHHAGLAAFVCAACADPTACRARFLLPEEVRFTQNGSALLPEHHLATRKRAPADAKAERNSKLYGKPEAIQEAPEPVCSFCARKMRFIAQVDAALEPALPFGDSGRGYLLACAEEHSAYFEWDCH